MATRQHATDSTDGLPIKISAVATPGDDLHTIPANEDDTIAIWAHNDDPDLQTLTLELGGVVVPDNISRHPIQPKNGWVLVMPGFRFGGTGAFDIAAFASKTNVITVMVQIIRE